MIKAIIFMGLGALIFYLYQNPGEMTSVIAVVHFVSPTFQQLTVDA